MVDYTVSVPLALSNTNPAIVVYWLKEYVTSMRHHYEFEKKIFTLVLKTDPEEERMHPGMAWPYEVNVEVLCKDDDGEYIGGDVVEFVIMPLYDPFTQEGNWLSGTVELVVTGKLTWGTGSHGYIRELLLAIAQRWDGIEEQLRRYPWVYAEEEHIDDEEGMTQPQMSTEDAASDILPDKLHPGGRYGTNRDLTFEDVKAIVTRCRAFQERGGKVPDFYDQLDIDYPGPRYFELETLRGWLKDPKFAPEDSQ